MKKKNPDDMRGIMIFGPRQEAVIKFLDKLHLVVIEKAMKYTHPFRQNDNQQIYVCAVTGFGPLITLVNYLFGNNIIGDDISRSNIDFLERSLSDE